MIRVFWNFQAVIYDFLFHWGINMRWDRCHIPLFIHQQGKDKRTHKSNEGKVCLASKNGYSYLPENAQGHYFRSSKQLELLLASLPAYAIQPLQLIQNAAARLVFNLPKFSHITPLLWSLHWLPVATRIRFKVLTLAYAAANKTAPHYLQDSLHAYTPARPLHSAATCRLAHPASHVTVSRSSQLRSFSTLVPQWWNDLPIPIRTAPSLPIFRSSLKTHLFTLYLDSPKVP